MKLDYDTLIFLTETFESFETDDEAREHILKGVQYCIGYMKEELNKIHTKENAEYEKTKIEDGFNYKNHCEVLKAMIASFATVEKTSKDIVFNELLEECKSQINFFLIENEIK